MQRNKNYLRNLKEIAVIFYTLEQLDIKKRKYDIKDKLERTVIFVPEFGRKYKLTTKQALSMVFNSDTYQKLMDKRTLLYYQSPKYAFAFWGKKPKKRRLS